MASRQLWIMEEDEKLMESVRKYGARRWGLIASFVEGRTGKQCRERWFHHVNPDIRKGAWTAEEDALILSMVSTHGRRWSVIARALKGRTDNAVKNRHESFLKRRYPDTHTPPTPAKVSKEHGALSASSIAIPIQAATPAPSRPSLQPVLVDISPNTSQQAGRLPSLREMVQLVNMSPAGESSAQMDFPGPPATSAVSALLQLPAAPRASSSLCSISLVDLIANSPDLITQRRTFTPTEAEVCADSDSEGDEDDNAQDKEKSPLNFGKNPPKHKSIGKPTRMLADSTTKTSSLTKQPHPEYRLKPPASTNASVDGIPAMDWLWKAAMSELATEDDAPEAE